MKNVTISKLKPEIHMHINNYNAKLCILHTSLKETDWDSYVINLNSELEIMKETGLMQ